MRGYPSLQVPGAIDPPVPPFKLPSIYTLILSPEKLLLINSLYHSVLTTLLIYSLDSPYVNGWGHLSLYVYDVMSYYTHCYTPSVTILYTLSILLSILLLIV